MSLLTACAATPSIQKTQAATGAETAQGAAQIRADLERSRICQGLTARMQAAFDGMGKRGLLGYERTADRCGLDPLAVEIDMVHEGCVVDPETSLALDRETAEEVGRMRGEITGNLEACEEVTSPKDRAPEFDCAVATRKLLSATEFVAQDGRRLFRSMHAALKEMARACVDVSEESPWGKLSKRVREKAYALFGAAPQ